MRTPLQFVFVLLLGCALSAPTPPRGESKAAAHPRGLFAALDLREHETFAIYRAGMTTPEFEVSSFVETRTFPLRPGVYVAVVRSPSSTQRRLFEVRDQPLVAEASLETRWNGESPTVLALTDAQSRWSATAEPFADDPLRGEALRRFEALREAAHQDARALPDPQVRALGPLAVELAFLHADAPPSAPALLASLPAPTEPLLAVLDQFPAPLWAALRDAAPDVRARGLAWLDAVASENPEPCARAMALFFALTLAREDGDAAGVQRRYASIPALDIDDAWILTVVRAQFAPERRARPGATMPRISFAKLDEPEVVVHTDALHGSIVLLHFWATWCRPCVAKIPALHEVHARLPEGAPDGVRVHFVSINLDPDPAVARRFRREQWPMPWTNLHIGDNDADAVLSAFGLLGPGRLLVGPDGVILATSERLGDTLESTLAEVLGSTATAGGTLSP